MSPAGRTGDGARRVADPPTARPAYARAGVDVAAGDRAVELMRARVSATHGPGVLAGLGGFASAVCVPAGMREPVLVGATDGVGTKTALARAMRRLDTIGEDLVAMCADDVVCLGARPLFFLDYVAVGRVDPVEVAALVGGVARGCELAGCALVGGETAEHPGLMAPDEFDLAGFCVGIVERDGTARPAAVEAGDALLGLAASGLHANGYSLVRALLAHHDLPLDRPYLEVVRAVLGARKRRAWPPRSRGRGVPRSATCCSPQPGSTRATCWHCASISPLARLRCTVSRTSPAAGCRATCRAPCRTCSPRSSTSDRGRSRR